MAEMSQEEMLAAQKANCPFCKIVKGEIPSKKVYEDDQMLAILDINPANKGHVLVMPKEHYPILPLIPPSTFKHLFVTTKKLMAAMRKGLIVPKVTLFLANGGAAGQMSPHFLYHLIPREDGDGLDKLDVLKRETSQKELGASLQQNMQAIMRNHLAREMRAGSPVAKLATEQEEQKKPTQQNILQAPAATKQEQRTNSETSIDPTTSKEEATSHLLLMLQQNPQLKQLIMQNPELVESYAKKSPELTVLFEGVNISALSAKLKQAEAQTKKEHVEKKTKVSTEDTPIDDVPDAETLTDDELLVYLDQKPRLRDMLIHDLEGLVALTRTNPRVAAFFVHTTPHALAERLLAIIAQHDEAVAEQKLKEKYGDEDATSESSEIKEEGVDFDALAKLLEEKK